MPAIILIGVAVFFVTITHTYSVFLSKEKTELQNAARSGYMASCTETDNRINCEKKANQFMNVKQEPLPKQK